jgi:hypothetical protein
MPKKHNLGLKPSARLEQVGGKQSKGMDHRKHRLS